MVREDDSELGTRLDDVANGGQRELIRVIAAADRDANREIYDALEDE